MIALITAIPFVGPLLGPALAFFLSPAGRFVLVGLVGLYGGWHLKGEIDEAHQARATIAAARAHAAELDRQATATRQIAEAAAARQQADAAEIRRLDQKVQDYVDKLSKRPPAAACRADDADVRFFMRGGRRAGPVRAATPPPKPGP